MAKNDGADLESSIDSAAGFEIEYVEIADEKVWASSDLEASIDFGSREANTLFDVVDSVSLVLLLLLSSLLLEVGVGSETARCKRCGLDTGDDDTDADSNDEETADFASTVSSQLFDGVANEVGATDRLGDAFSALFDKFSVAIAPTFVTGADGRMVCKNEGIAVTRD